MLIPGMWVSDSKGSDNHPSSLGSATGGTGQGVCTSSSLLGFGLLQWDLWKSITIFGFWLDILH